jgi:hypothetical protein
VTDEGAEIDAPSKPWYKRKTGALGKLGLGLCFLGSVVVPRLDVRWWPVLMIVVWVTGVLLWLIDLRRSGQRASFNER